MSKDSIISIRNILGLLCLSLGPTYTQYGLDDSSLGHLTWCPAVSTFIVITRLLLYVRQTLMIAFTHNVAIVFLRFNTVSVNKK